MKFCENYSVVVTALDNKTQKLTRTRCKQWNCEYCASVNRRVWMYRIIETLIHRPTSEQWHFMTLTLPSEYHDNKDVSGSIKHWQSVSNKLFGQLRYRLGKFMYIRIYEQHKSGVFHMHVLLNATFPDVERNIRKDETDYYYSETLAKICKTQGLGKIHDMRPIKTENHEENGHARNVASYVTKYLTKSIQGTIQSILNDENISRVRLIQTSHGWHKMQSDSDLQWRKGRISKQEFDALQQDKISVFDLDLKREVEEEDYENTYYYPDFDESQTQTEKSLK